MLIFEEPRMIFVHIPKSGGSSMATALKGSAQRYGWINGPTQKTHADFEQACQVVGLEWAKTAVSFAILRNPWARMLSLWRFQWRKAEERIARGTPSPLPNSGLTDLEIVEEARRVPFSDWLVNAEYHSSTYGISMTQKSQLSWCRGPTKDLAVSKILLLERLDMAFLSQIGIIDFPHVNAGPPVNYRDHYSQRARDHVARWFADDIAYGAYDF